MQFWVTKLPLCANFKVCSSPMICEVSKMTFAFIVVTFAFFIQKYNTTYKRFKKSNWIVRIFMAMFLRFFFVPAAQSQVIETLERLSSNITGSPMYSTYTV